MEQVTKAYGLDVVFDGDYDTSPVPADRVFRLNLTGATGRVFTEYDLLSVSLFAGHAAIAIANARLHEAENERQARLSQAR